jgi:hypothetical protein
MIKRESMLLVDDDKGLGFVFLSSLFLWCLREVFFFFDDFVLYFGINDIASVLSMDVLLSLFNMGIPEEF